MVEVTVLLILTQRVPVFFSSRYPVIGAPPSDAGGCHDNLHEFLKTSDTSGVLGAPGTAEKKTIQTILTLLLSKLVCFCRTESSSLMILLRYFEDNF